MKKHLLTFLMTLLVFPALAATDCLTAPNMGISGQVDYGEATITSSNVKIGTTSKTPKSALITSGAEYACTELRINYVRSGSKLDMQMRNSDKGHGIFYVTKSGGTLKSIKFTAGTTNTNMKVTVYGSNTAYTGTGTSYGTKLGELNSTGTITPPESSDYKYFTFEATTGTIYINQIDIEWGESQGGDIQTGPVAPNVSFTDMSIEMGTTAKAGTWPSDLTTIAFTPVTDGIITIADDGTITPVAVGETQVNVSWTEVTDKYTAGSTSFNVTVFENIPLEDIKFVKATSFEPGKRYIITGKIDSDTYIMSSTPASSNIPAKKYNGTISNDEISLTPNASNEYDYLVLTLGQETNGKYYFSDGGSPTDIKYLNSGTGTSSNKLYFTHQTSTDVALFEGNINATTNIATIYFTCKTSRNYLYLNENNSSPIFNCYTNSSQYNGVTLYVEKTEEPEPTVVTLTWGEADQEYTVGQEGVAISLTVEPNTQEAKNVVKISSSDETKVKATYFGGDNEVALTFLDAAENVTLTAEIVDNRNEYKGDPKTISFKVNAKPVEVVEPGQVVSTPAAENDVINVRQGATITFSSENAAKLKVESINGESSNIVNNPYTYTANELDILTVTPIDAAGTEYTDMQLVVEINVEVAPAITANTTATFNFVESECYHPNYGSGAQGVQNTYYFISEDPGMFGAMFNVASGNGGSFEYVAGQGWKFIKGDASECNYFIHFTMQEAFSNCNYFINGIKLNTNSNDADTPTFKIEDTVNNPGSFNGNVWTGNSTTNYVTVEIHSTADFILNSIDVTFEHPEVEKPYAVFAAENVKDKFILKHNKADHKIYYRVTEGAAQAAYRAADNSDFTEFTAGTQIPLNNTQVLHFYAKHPHGMMSEVTSMTRDELIATGVEGIVTDEADVQWFNMQGVRVSEPTEGVYIRVQNGKAAKVVK